MNEKEIREAIGELQERIDLYEESYRGTVPEYYDALRTAVESLKKQHQVPAQKEWDKSIGEEKYYRYVCPECENVLRPRHEYKCCPYCGQRIDWEEAKS